MPFELKNRRVLVLGLGASGMSMVRWLAGRGADVRVADSRAAPPFAGQMRAAFPQVKEVFGYFNNHWAGHSPASANEMKQR
ncbi:MAG: hypothetical protein ABL878_06980, partial [Burkholderiales bacterium]